MMRNLKGFLRLAAAAYQLRRQGFTHLHAHWADKATEVAMVLSRLLELPFSFTCHAVDIFVSPRYLKEKLRAARFVVTVSDYNKRYLMTHHGLDLEDKIHVIYPLIDVHRFSPRPSLHCNGVNILSVGRLVEKKGYPYAVEAAQLLKARGHRFVWKIVGEGRDRPQLEVAIRDHGLNGSVRLLGKLPPADVNSLLDQATAFVLPCVVASNGDREGMPAVLIEAMAKEVPVVATTSVGIPELVKDGAGLLVPPRDSVALAEAVEQIITSDRSLQEEMGRTGRRIVEREFDARHLAGRLIALFESGS
jgi:colanic acid/amylovoran biosynthesis glycosyltransferase